MHARRRRRCIVMRCSSMRVACTRCKCGYTTRRCFTSSRASEHPRCKAPIIARRKKARTRVALNRRCGKLTITPYGDCNHPLVIRRLTLHAEPLAIIDSESNTIFYPIKKFMCRGCRAFITAQNAARWTIRRFRYCYRRRRRIVPQSWIPVLYSKRDFPRVE